METTRLRQIGPDIPASLLEPPPEQPLPSPAAPRPNVDSASIGMLLAGLRALSQRTIIAIGNLFVLAAASSAFWLWLTTMPDPSIHQLVGLTLYGVLMLALCHLVLRRR